MARKGQPQNNVVKHEHIILVNAFHQSPWLWNSRLLNTNKRPWN